MRRRGTSRVKNNNFVLINDNKSINLSSLGITGNVTDLGSSRDFSKLYVLMGAVVNKVYQIQIVNNSDVSQSTYNNLNISVGSDSRGFYVNNLNNKIYTSSSNIVQYDLSNTDDVSTAVNANKNFAINGGQGFTFSADEKRIFKVGSFGSSTNRIIYRYDLATAGDGTTLSEIIEQYDMTGEILTNNDICFIDNGMRILVGGDKLNVYQLINPYSLIGMSLINQFSLVSFRGMTVNENLKKIYLESSGSIKQYSYT